MQTPDLARQSLLAEDAYANFIGTDSPGFIPPNMRRESSAQWSETADSEALLIHDGQGGSGSIRSRS